MVLTIKSTTYYVQQYLAYLHVPRYFALSESSVFKHDIFWLFLKLSVKELNFIQNTPCYSLLFLLLGAENLGKSLSRVWRITWQYCTYQVLPHQTGMDDLYTCEAA